MAKRDEPAEPAGAGVADDTAGVRVVRRTVLRAAGLAVAGAALAPARAALAATRASTGRGREARVRDAFERFTEEWRELAERFFELKDASEDAYLWSVTGRLARLERDTVPARRRTVHDRDGVSTGPVWAGGELFVVELRLEPGAELRPHDHPSHAVVTLAVAGSSVYRHFEPQGDVPERSDGKTPFVVRETRRGLLLPGRTTQLSRATDNAHAFVAGEDGATLLDFTTTVADGPRFAHLELDDEPRDAFEGLYEARWGSA